MPSPRESGTVPSITPASGSWVCGACGYHESSTLPVCTHCGAHGPSYRKVHQCIECGRVGQDGADGHVAAGGERCNGVVVYR